MIGMFQLFMIGSIRDYILTAEGAADETIEAEEMDDKLENEVSDIVISAAMLACLASTCTSITDGINCSKCSNTPSLAKFSC